MKQRLISLITTAAAMGMLIIDSKQALSAASEGVDICMRTIIPSLFPFFVLSIYLTGNLGGQSILISGLLGGYPVGAQAAAESWRSGNISRITANQYLRFCSQAGPSFLFGMVAGQFPDGRYAWLLWAIQLLSAGSVALLFPAERKIATSEAPRIALSVAMKKATHAIASVCGWVVVFRIIIGFAQRWGLFLLPQWVHMLAAGFLELTNGCLMLGNITSISLRFVCAALMLNFGGICVLMQTSAVTEGLDMKYYIQGKLLQTLFSLLYSICFLGKYIALLPVFGIFLLTKLSNLRKNSSIPAPVGV